MDKDKLLNSIKNVLILGSGSMGLQIGLQCALYGFNVTVYDAYEKALEKAENRLFKLADVMTNRNRVSREKAADATMRIRFTADPEPAGQNADLISESIPEDPELKRKVFAQFNEICPEHTIFTTNSSTLVPSMIAEATGRPDRFAALHFHDLLVTNIVDIMPHPGTCVQTLEDIRLFCQAIDLYPIELKKEQHGYVYNTMLVELLQSALLLASKEVASVQDIDRAWMGIMKTRVGPFGIMDSIGLDTAHKVIEYWAGVNQDPQSHTNAALLKKRVEKGELGVKSGRGFYQYPKPDFLDPKFMKDIR